MPTTDYLEFQNATNVIAATGGNLVWNNPENALVNDASSAFADDNVGSTLRTQYLTLTQLSGLTKIWRYAKVTQVDLEVERYALNPGPGIPSLSVHDDEVVLIIGGERQADNQADQTTVWPNTATVKTYSFTVNNPGKDFQGTDFGVAFRVWSGTAGTSDIYVNYIKARLTLTQPTSLKMTRGWLLLIMSKDALYVRVPATTPYKTAWQAAVNAYYRYIYMYPGVASGNSGIAVVNDAAYAAYQFAKVLRTLKNDGDEASLGAVASLVIPILQDECGDAFETPGGPSLLPENPEIDGAPCDGGALIPKPLKVQYQSSLAGPIDFIII